MEGSDSGRNTLHNASSSNTEYSIASPSTSPSELSQDPLSVLPTPDPLSSEALENCSRLDLSFASSGAPSDRLFQDPSSEDHGSPELPLRGPSSILTKQLQHMSAQESASMEQPLEESSSSLKSSRSFSPDQRLKADGIADLPLHEVPNEFSPSEGFAEGSRQNPLTELRQFSSSDERLQAEELTSSTAANQNSLADDPVSTSYDSSAREDSPCSSAEHEVSDDVKREMLKERCKGAAILSCKSEATGDHCYVYLIGTAHVSEESCREVREAIALMKPEVVFVELCRRRSFILEKTHFSVPTVSDMLVSWKERRSNMLGILYSWFLAKVANKLDVLPGSEFRAAFEEAQAQGAKFCLGDRDIEVTLRRTWGKMSTWHKSKLIATLVLQAIFLPKADQLNELIEKLQDADMLTVAFEELGKTFPTVMETVIDERDMFMAAVLQKLAEDNASIVAVVGRGHVAGISKYWGQDIHIHSLSEVPLKKPVWNPIVKHYVLSAATVAFMGIGALLYVRSGS